MNVAIEVVVGAGGGCVEAAGRVVLGTDGVVFGDFHPSVDRKSTAIDETIMRII